MDIESGSLPPTADGSDWGQSAFKFLQDALQAANDLFGSQTPPDRVDIWVAQGTYETDNIFGFEIPSNVRLFGGFEGTETDRLDRPLDPTTTILTDDPEAFGIAIVQFGGTDGTARLDGVTIRDTNAEAFSTVITFSNSDAILSNCSISENVGESTAVMVTSSSNPRIINCQFIGNDDDGINTDSRAVETRGLPPRGNGPQASRQVADCSFTGKSARCPPILRAK